jgi:hypothetical protein
VIRGPEGRWRFITIEPGSILLRRISGHGSNKGENDRWIVLAGSI